MFDLIYYLIDRVIYPSRGNIENSFLSQQKLRTKKKRVQRSLMVRCLKELNVGHREWWMYGKEWQWSPFVPVVLSLFESGIVSPRDRDLSIRICRSSCGLEFGSCRPFSRGFAGTGRPLGIFSLTFSLNFSLIFSFGCFGIIVILLCLRGNPSDEGAAGSAGFGTLC